MMHTPGPWHRNIKPATKYVTIFAGKNKHICHLSPGGMTLEEAEANLNLIASAPELLEALREASRALTELDPLGEKHNARLMDNALAKTHA